MTGPFTTNMKRYRKNRFFFCVGLNKDTRGDYSGPWRCYVKWFASYVVVNMIVNSE